MQFKIICPSKGRAHNVRTLSLIPSLELVVPFGEGEAYKKNYPDTVVYETPKHIKGITPTRQWILDEFKDHNIFMIDDDVVSVRKNYHFGEGEMTISCQETIYEIIRESFSICQEIGSRIFSFSKIRNPLEYNSFSPIVHTGYMNASFCGFVKDHGLSYDLSMSEGEDHYISCLAVYKYRYSMIDNRYSFVTDGNFTALGGCNDYRTRESMIKNTLYLRKLFGEAILYKEPTALKVNVNIGERSLKFPY